MLFERFEVEGLAHYSYAVGCPAAGRLAIVDPERNVDRYLAFAAAQGLRISHVLETHIHADYASGARALADETGAVLGVSGYDTGEKYEVGFPHQDLRDGAEIRIGAVRIVALHTPGHTPEHLSFLVHDEARTRDVPMLLLSGDFLFVGSLGRPDLLGEEAKEALAHALFDSVRIRLADLPDGLEIHPAHGAGSMCGAGMSGRPSSTLGYERLANPFLDPALDEASFVERILSGVPPFPPYYLRMKALNSRGPAVLAALPGRHGLGVEEFQSRRDDGHLVIDLRSQVAFDGAHIPGSLGIGLGPRFSTWASWTVPADTPLLIVAAQPADAVPAARALIRVGLDDLVGYLDGGIEAWREAGGPIAQTTMMQPAEVHEALKRGEIAHLLDVRSDEEWEEGHVRGALHLMAGYLPERLDEVPRSAGPIAVICNSGYRSALATSVLERAGFERVIDIIGGMTAWRAAGLPVVRDHGAVATPS